MSAMSNRHLFERLIAEGRIDVRRSDLFDAAPAPLAGADLAGRVEGMLLGLAAGDALGNTSESMTAADRRARRGEIRDYAPNRHAGGAAVGLPSDDTQMAFWALEEMLASGGLDPGRVADAFRDGRRIFGLGSSVRGFLRASRAGGTWIDWAQPSAGNGALMRIAPALLPHVQSPTPDLWGAAALLGAVTHNDEASISCCVSCGPGTRRSTSSPRPISEP